MPDLTGKLWRSCSETCSLLKTITSVTEQSYTSKKILNFTGNFQIPLKIKHNYDLPIKYFLYQFAHILKQYFTLDKN